MPPVDAGAQYTLMGPERVADVERAVNALQTDVARLWDLALFAGLAVSIAVVGSLVVAVVAYRRTRSNSADIAELSRDIKAITRMQAAQDERLARFSDAMHDGTERLLAAVSDAESIASRAAEGVERAASRQAAEFKLAHSTLQGIMSKFQAMQRGDPNAQG